MAEFLYLAMASTICLTVGVLVGGVSASVWAGARRQWRTPRSRKEGALWA